MLLLVDDELTIVRCERHICSTLKSDVPLESGLRQRQLEAEAMKVRVRV